MSPGMEEQGQPKREKKAYLSGDENELLPVKQHYSL